MIVCVCKRVSDRDIRASVELGADTVDALRDRFGLGTCCGRCVPSAAEEIARAARSTPVALAD